jgi:hypothetical protein
VSEDPLKAISLVPVNYFLIEIPFHQKKSLLPSTGQLCIEDHFADVYAAWSREGLSFLFDVRATLGEEDSVELFIDTRDIKNAGFNHRFCHHFVFLPEPIEGEQAYEATHFRTEDTHPLCDPKELSVAVTPKKKGYKMEVEIPSSCLHGYDPEQFDRIGFTYRINRSGDTSQHFSVISAEFDLEQTPSLWSRVRLQ